MTCSICPDDLFKVSRNLNNLDFILIYKTPFNKIKNKYHALYFIKEIIRQINTKEIDYSKTDEFGLLEENIHINDFKPIFMRIDNKNESK